MKPLTIGIIVCVIIAIILVVYFITKKTPAEPSLLEKVLKAFGIRIEPTTSEHFSTDVEFKTNDDIINKFMLFLGYLFPKMNIDNINLLLTQYNSDKTMQEILTEKKDKINLNEFNDIVMGNGNIINYYNGYMYDETNDKTIIENLYTLTTIVYVVMFKYMINLDSIKQMLPSEYQNISYVQASISDDYKTSNMVDVYLRTNYNEDIKIKDAIPFPIDLKIQNQCYTNKLCKQSANILEYINSQKEYNLANMNILKKLFDLSMVKYLLTLNGSNLDKITFDFTLLSNDLPIREGEFSGGGEQSLNDQLKSNTQMSLDRMKEMYNTFDDADKNSIQTEYDNFMTAGNALITAINNGATDVSALNNAFEDSKTALTDKINSAS